MVPSSPHSFTCPVIIGRDQELALLADWVAGDGSGVMLVFGEAGIGKTRLIRATIERARTLGHCVISTGCYETDRSTPYAPFIDALREIGAEHSLSALTAGAGPDATVLARLLPELARLAPPPSSDGEGPDERRRLHEAMLRALHGAAGRRPLLLVIEDLHWCDEGSLDFLLFLIHRSPPASRVLLSYRSDETGPALDHLLAESDRTRMATEIALSRLDPTAIDAMLRAILDYRPVSAELLHLVTALTEGNPFFIEELLKSLAPALRAPDLATALLPSFDQVLAPRSVQDAVARRTAQLSPEAGRILALAAIAGHHFDFALLGTVAEVDDDTLLLALKELVAGQLIVEEADDRFVFRHALTRQAVVAGLLTRERRRLHRVIAEAMMPPPDTQFESDPATLAEHCFAAGMWDDAVVWAQRAGERALAVDVPAVAVYHFTRALEAASHIVGAPHGALHLGRGQAYETLGEFEQAQADYIAARSEAQAEPAAPAMEVEALLNLGLLWAGRDYARTSVWGQAALAVARQSHDPLLVARSLNRLGNWFLNVEQPDQAIAHHREALAIFEARGNRNGMAETLDLLGVASMLSGDLASGIALLHRAIALWRELGDRRGLASTLLMLTAGGPTFHTDTVPAATHVLAAQATCEEAIAIARQIGWRAGEAWGLWAFGGLSLAAHGDYARALGLMQQGLTIAEEIDHRQWIAAAHCFLGRTYLDMLDFTPARHHMEIAVTLTRAIASPYWQRTATAWLASLTLAEGRLTEAERVLDDAFRAAQADIPLGTIAGRLLWAARAELLLAQGAPADALAIADQLAGSVPRPAGPGRVARLEKLRSEALLALGRIDDANEALEIARDVATATGARAMLWRILAIQCRLFVAQGRNEDAGRVREEGHNLIDTLASGITQDGPREPFRAAALTAFPSIPGHMRRINVSDAVGGLTSREREVARLVAQGRSNHEIGEALFIADWTAATHVRNILAKLNLSSRAQIAAWAVAHGLSDAS